VSAFLGAAASLAAVALVVRLAGRQHRLLHLFQLEHYEPARLTLWLRRRRERRPRAELAGAGALYVLAGALAAWVSRWAAGAVLLATIPPAIALGVRDWRRPAVKPLVLTPRATRLLGASLAPPLALALATIALASVELSAVALSIVLALAWLALALAPETLLSANRALAPVQASINRRYVRAARATLERQRPLTIGVTGSYGKTTTKFCLGAVLGEQRPTLVTPDSYNSHLGVVRTINERLRPSHEVFVVEMGMYRRGDIAELCALVHPTIGVITAIGPMHLERLGSIDAIAAAKGELLDALPPHGHLVTNADDERCRALAARAHVPVTLFSIDHPDAAVRASEIRIAGGRTQFALHLPHLGGGAPVAPGAAGAPAAHRAAGPAARGAAGPLEVSAQLLGRHNVHNLLAAAAVGSVVGLQPATIARALSQVRAPAHRLQPIHNNSAGVVVIDDAYNSNPHGAAAALEVLREHDAARRLLVTPGMVELGALESTLNRELGERAGAVCDMVILVGPERTRPIFEGLLAGGMEERDVRVVRDIHEATAVLRHSTRPGDVVLFENDLPDTYAEPQRAEPQRAEPQRAESHRAESHQ